MKSLRHNPDPFPTRGGMGIPRPLLVALLAMALPSAVAAQRTMVIESFDSELRVGLDGSVEVTETVRPRFTGSWQGIYRDLSLEHNTAEGRLERLRVELIGITNEDGEPLQHEDTEEGRWSRRFRVWIPGAEDATPTVVIKYVVRNTLRFFREGSETGLLDELYWNVTGNSWEVPIEAATARVILPDAITPSQWAGYTGTSGTTETAVDIRVEGNVVKFAATRPLGSYEGLTVAVGWPAGAVPRPPPPSKLLMFLRLWWPLALPFLALWLAFSRWQKHGRDPAKRAIAVQYEPPADLTPTELGTLVDHKAQMHDLTATLVDLAVRGYIHIEKRTRKVLGAFTSTGYHFHLKKPGTEWDSLSRHEQLYLEAMFHSALAYSAPDVEAATRDPDLAPDEPAHATGEGPTYATVSLSSLANRFYTAIPDIRNAVYRQLIDRGYYERNPSEVKVRWIALGAFTLVAAFIAGVYSQVQYPPTTGPLVLGAALGVSGIIFLVWGPFMSARTRQGARAQELALGFRQFLDQVEEDRFRRMITSAELFERYLPFAMAFKVEGKWAKAFEDMYADPPRWYSGYDGGAFRASSFTSDLGRMSSTASATMSSSPGSSGSSSSGSGGGGSSGGGSGGGGGGGF